MNAGRPVRRLSQLCKREMTVLRIRQANNADGNQWTELGHILEKI